MSIPAWSGGLRGAVASPLDAQPPSSGRARAWAIAGAALLHLGVVGMVAFTSVQRAAAPRPSVPVTQMVQIELPKPLPPPATVASAPPEPVEAPRPPPPIHHIRPPPSPPSPKPVEPPRQEAPPPAAAQAGKVLAAEPNQALPAPTESIQTGLGAHYAGGTTASAGTDSHAVADPNARAGGVEGGTGTELRGDLTRAPALAGGASWNCPFPPEADDEGIDHAVVTLRVEVGADGRAASAVATKDPGTGFGREARRCALRQRWAPGLDRAGQPRAASALVNVVFDR